MKYRSPKTGRFVDAPSKRNQALVNELYRAFDFFNEVFADKKLPKCIITIQNKGRRNACGWFSYGRWDDNVTSKGIPEINISAEYAAGGATPILETLLHEMAHFWNAEHDTKDCTAGQYHNKKFKLAAEQFGLIVERCGSRGWAWTTLAEEGKKAIEELNPDREAFKSLRRKSGGKVEKKYTSLIVNLDLGDRVKEAASSRGVSQRDLVEEALNLHLNS